jgi:hypothetical protein
MLEISISGELAVAAPGFMAGCARGYQVEVFDSARPRGETSAGVAEQIRAAAGELASIGVAAVLAAASPGAGRLWGVCDRCWQPGFVYETGRETIGLCEQCIDGQLRRLQQAARTISDAALSL